VDRGTAPRDRAFLVANLGHTFAEAGHRTLLIDGDIRRAACCTVA
jgi:Mrp family chromosome partitioning ATPase